MYTVLHPFIVVKDFTSNIHNDCFLYYLAPQRLLHTDLLMHANEPKSLVLRDDDKHEVKMNQNSSYNSNDCRDNNLMSTNYNQSSNDQDNEDDDVDNFLNNVRQEETTSLLKI